MDVKFLSPNPNSGFTSAIEELLGFGTSRVCVAVAFCTRAGVDILCNHSSRIRGGDSFVVVSSSAPTDLQELGRLHGLCPGKVRVHFGATSPVETNSGPPLMHSKIYFGQKGSEAILIVGSTNLTASALNGFNQEAAIRIRGSVHEPVFIDALKHLEALKLRAMPWSPEMLTTEVDSSREGDVLLIHAESAGIHLDPGRFAHIRVSDEKIAKLLVRDCECAIYLHHLGTLRTLKPSESGAYAAYRGTLTGTNRKEEGIPAEWGDATYFIDEDGGCLVLTDEREPPNEYTHQAVIRIDALAPNFRDRVWFSEQPKGSREPHTVPRPHAVKPGIAQYFGEPAERMNLTVQEVTRISRKYEVSVQDRKRISRETLAQLFPSLSQQSSPQSKGPTLQKFIARVRFFIERRR